MRRFNILMQALLCIFAITLNSCGGDDNPPGQEQYSIKTSIVDKSQLDANELNYLDQVCGMCSFKLNAKSTEAAAIALYDTQIAELTSKMQEALGNIYSRKGHKASVNIQLVNEIGNAIKSTLVNTDESQGGYDKQLYSIALVITNVGTMTEEQQQDLAAFCEEHGDNPEKPMSEEDAIKYYDQVFDSYKSLLQTKMNIFKKAGASGASVDIQLLNEKGEVVKSNTVNM